jgi:hypothetical protein
MKLRRSISIGPRAIALAAAAAILTATLVLACGDDSSPSNATATVDAAQMSALTDVATVNADSSAPQATARFVHLASNLGDVDFCLQSATAEAFVGPILAGDGLPGSDAGSANGGDAAANGSDGSTDDGGGEATEAGANDDAGDAVEGGAATSDAGPSTALAPRTMTNYITFPGSGTFQVAVVAGGSTTCATPLATLIVTLDPGKLATVALAGVYTPSNDAGTASLSLLRFIDDPKSDATNARVRIIHAALGTTKKAGPGALTVSVKGADSPVLAAHVDPGQAAAADTSPPTDMLGYALVTPVPPATALVVAPAAGADAGGLPSWTSAFTDLGLDATSLHTGFVVSDETQSFAVVWCSDQSTVGKRIDCKTIAQPMGDQ